MKRKLTLSLFVTTLLIVPVFMTNCTKNAEQVIDEDSVASRLSFKKISNEEIITKSGSKDASAVIVRIEFDEFGRTSRNCKGWGLCNYEIIWFPKDESKSLVTNNDYRYSFPIFHDTNMNRFYIEILLDKPVPNDLPLDDFPLKVDELMVLDSYKIFNKDLFILNGDYRFNRNLGDYGGFVIYLED